jgi:hypothetical protein
MLRPMELGEIFNEAFYLYQRNFLLFVGIGAIVHVPYQLLVALLPRYPILGYLAMIGFWIPLVAASGAIVKALADRYLGNEVTIAGSYRYMLPRLIPYLITSVLGGLLVFVGFLLFLVPGIIFAFWITFLPSVMIVEDRFYVRAIERSRQLAAGEWGRIAAIGLLMIGLFMGVYLIIGVFVAILMVIATMAGSGGPQIGESMPMWLMLFQGILGAVLQSLLSPITVLLPVLLYFDVRVRKEGFDIELLARSMNE